MFCTNCGSKLVDGAKFCSECGARVVRPEEPVFRTNPDIQFEEPKVAEPVIDAPVYDETPDKPVRESVSFDWSNVVDEPHRKDVSDIKSPWATTGGIDEKAIYAEMTPSTEKSRTMSFIDVLRAEKEEKEKAAADKAIEYTEVLRFDPDLTAFDEAPQLHYAPLYEDVDEPVTTPFDAPEEEKDEPLFEEPVLEDGPLFEEPVLTDEPLFEEPVFAEEPKFEEPAEEPVPVEEPEFSEPEYEEPQRMAEAAEEPELEVSRETIAQFDEYVKSFEKEAGIISEPEIEEPKIEEPVYEAPKFELPDFLKKVTEFAARKEEAPEVEEPAAEEPVIEEPEIEEPVAEEPVFEEPLFEEAFEPEITPDIDELFAGLTPASQADVEEAEAAEEAEVEEPAEETFEEPKYDEGEYDESGESEESMEDLYLDFESAAPSGRTMRFDASAYDEEDDDDDDDDDEEEATEAVFEEPAPEKEPVDDDDDDDDDDKDEVEDDEDDDDKDDEDDDEEGIDEEELFREMEEVSPEVPGMTIAPPADKQEEIEALRKRLAELTGVDLYEVADLNSAMSLDELEEAEEPAEEPVQEEPEEVKGDELFEEPSDDLFEVEVTPDIDELFNGLTPASMVIEPEVPDVEEAAEEEPVPEPEVPEIAEPVEEEAVEEETKAAAVTDIDALLAELVAEKAPAEPVIEEVVEEAVVEAEPVIEEAVEEAVVEPAAEEIVEEPAEEVSEDAVEDIYLQDAEPFERAPREFREEPEEIFEEEPEVPEVEEAVEEEPAVEPEVPEIEEAAEEVAPVEETFEDILAEPLAVEEPVVEEEPVAAEEPVVEEEPEETPAVKETDALSLEELERDLFGETLPEEAEAEETKKIDKFYTLYRKNEEFQRLLDEEYEKLKHGGGLTEEEKAAVDAVPKMADVEAAKDAAALGAVAAEAIPVENKKAYRQVEDETIYMSKEELDAKLKAEAAAIAAAKAPVEVPADKDVKKKEEKKARKKKKVEVEYEDVESGSKVLTVLAVIIALILILLLAVILILQIAPESGAAAWIDSLIENLTANFSMIDLYKGQFLL